MPHDPTLMRTKTWYQNNPTLLTNLQNDLKIKYPSLHLFLENNIYFIRGNFPIVDAAQRTIDEFTIEVKIPDNFPKEVPRVREIGNKLPKIADRHFYPSGNACLFLLEERHKYLLPETTIMEFIEGPVKSFLIGQAGFTQTGTWIFGERAHNEAGIVDYYKNIINSEDIPTVTRFINYLSKSKVKGHWECYCGSKRKMRNCHFNTLLKTREYIKPKDVATSLFVITRKANKFLSPST